MRIMTIAMIILTCLILPCHGESTGELAKLPYATIHKLVSQQVSGTMKDEARFTIESSLPGVKPKDIKLYIDAKGGRIPVRLNTDGTFTLPIKEQLLKENPFLVTNQPKGSMTLNATFPIKPEFKFPYKGGEVRYSSLFVSDESFPQIAKEVSRVVNEVGISRTATKRTFEFIPADIDNSTVSIQSINGTIQMVPEQDGVVRINYDPLLSKENPWVLFPAAKEGWSPNVWMWVEGTPKSGPAGR